jgi:hypothetical protein
MSVTKRISPSAKFCSSIPFHTFASDSWPAYHAFASDDLLNDRGRRSDGDRRLIARQRPSPVYTGLAPNRFKDFWIE